MLHLAAKAFFPGRVPFPVLHVDTGHNFPEVLAFRDETVARLGVRLEVARVQDYIDDGRLHERADGTRNPLQTLPLLDAIAAGTPRRRLRRRPPRRGQGARQGADHLAARRVRPVGPAQPAPRAVEPVQRPPHARPARARLPDLELDRARRLALHRARADPAPAAVLRARARGVCARRHVARGRRVLAAARRRDRRAPRRPLPHRRRHELHRRGRIGCRGPRRRSSPRSPAPPSPSAARPAPTTASRRPRWKTARRTGTSDDRRIVPSDAPSRRHATARTAPARLFRFATAGSVDDGKSTLVGRLLHDSKAILADQLEQVARTSAERGFAHGDVRLRAADRRPARRARAGHHDRRRLPLLLHRQPQLHPRRLPRARAVHPQHGHRRDHRRRRGRARSTGARACSSRPAATSPSSRCCACRTSSSRSTRSTCSATTQEAFARVAAAGARPSPPSSASTTSHVLPGLGPRGRQHRRPLGAHALVRRSGAARAARGAARRRTSSSRRSSLPAAGAARAPPAGRAVARASPPTTRGRRCATTAPSPAASPRARVRVGDRVADLPVRHPHDRHGHRGRRAAGRRGRRARSRCRCSSPTTSTPRAAPSSPPPARSRPRGARSTPSCSSSTRARSTTGARVLVKHGTATVQAVIAQIESRYDLDTLAHEPADALEANDIGRVRLRLAAELPARAVQREPRGRLVPGHPPVRRRDTRRRDHARLTSRRTPHQHTHCRLKEAKP